MTTNFFIFSPDGQKQGPYDIVGVVKKIRNGSLTASTSICTDKDPTAKPAIEWSELAEFLQEQDAVEAPSLEVHKTKLMSLSQRLKSGWNFLQNNQLSTVYSGLFVLLIIFSLGLVSLAIPAALQMIAYGLFLVVIQYYFSGYVYSVLRMVRSQPVDFNFLRGKMRPLTKILLTTSFIMSFFIIIGLLLILSGVKILAGTGLLIVALPGFYFLSLYIFAPLLILDKDVEFWEALETSKKKMKSMGFESIGVVFSLLIINFLAGMVFLLPMIITLPITIAAICDVYDESFS